MWSLFDFRMDKDQKGTSSSMKRKKGDTKCVWREGCLVFPPKMKRQ